MSFIGRKGKEEVKQRERLLNMVNSAASVLLSINDEKSFEASLLKSFELVGQCLDLDRVQIWCNEVIKGELHFVHRYQWLSDYGRNKVPVPIGLHFPYKERPEWENSFLRREYINSPLSGLHEDDQAFLNSYGIKSIVIIPMFLEGNFWGVFSINDCHRERVFSDEEIHILTSVGLMMSSAVDCNIQSAKMREADERTQLMVDATPLCVNFWDRNHNNIDCNQEAVRLFELSGKQEYLERFYDLSPEYQPDGRLSRDKIVEFINKAFDEGYCRLEWMHQKLNGEPIPCELMLVRVRYNDDFIVVGYVRDLRELYASEQSLNVLANILNGLDAMVYVTVPDTGEILFVNHQMKKHFGIRDDVVGRICYEVFRRGMSKKCVFCPCHRLDKEPGTTVVWEEHNSLTKRIYHNTDRYIEWQNGRIVHIQQSVDVTELIEAKEQAQRSNLAKNQFLSRMSHEVRTPMNAILGITEIQLENKTLSPDTQEALGEIYNSGYLLLGIINDILDLSKIEAGKVELSPTNYDVPSLINDTVHLNVMRYDSKPIEFKLQVDENTPTTLYGDELRIRQILNNLLSNAFKYTEKGEVSLSVSTEPRGEEGRVTLVVRVGDTGQGMTAEQVDMLFDEYTRFNTEVNRMIEGTGLGMNIARHLVHMMGGEISVESELDKGSVFTVRLPQGVIDAGVLGRETAENLKQFRVGRAGQMKRAPQIIREFMPYGKILIVDDVESNLYVARGLMSPYGLSIETVASGFEAINKIKGGAAFDIIFMDHYMPKMDGMEAVKIIRELGYTQPIVALTANALTGQAEIFMKNGFDGFISKPIDIRLLNALLNKLIRDKYPPEVVETARRQAMRVNMAKYGAEEIDPASDPELTAIFSRDAKKAIARLNAICANTYRRADDIRQYVIDLHAMKSALSNIGETQLSAFAFKLEQAGRSGDVQTMMTETPVFLEELHEAIEKNKSKEDSANAAKKDSDKDQAYLNEKLLAIQKACEDYNEIAANAALAELEQRKWTRSTKELLDTISEYLLHSDFEEAASAARDHAK